MAASSSSSASGLSKEEQQAVKDRARELRQSKKRISKAEREALEAEEVATSIAGLDELDRTIALAVQRIANEVDPELKARLWYGMPAFTKNGKVIMHLLPAGKFHTRYATLGFEDSARLDEAEAWPVAYAITGLGEETESLIRRTITNAVQSTVQNRPQGD
ncbi:DUF1801 domain-containing protein [Bifidobacterium psychraerophilum]|jgi:uncharacterized protein YdhG (YjbR/CyaY superfamily)|uniref:YdhG-like domain-containing protein n=1 Tax=Bifidobacterium psychraerophilum TaxID=218140 RepID=A0A087CM08_9BIFI|nr:DUF1801 domain-containing protein [Bifidobacterium psychraerophilum]KFI84308.1 hypothetical protein BPSY_0186 [Bifidobacterium psychraerophilum]MCI1660803.1 DUF1801 domain-containing protein [Bifidobacterium psychraerophilum]MCI1804777.1 DUF1801 domain-containing protein [Bifidobacterium psychraerophilum]MCI2177303.1 DUF1801 domain-containing protein [Bifidobacterium psychraerophilum]MCI2182245.1 DUF1801 domain-containing protein [Bifidobacterium psychraerophilum]